MDSKCALCSCDLTEESSSSEHVIPNAIGGRLQVPGFVCHGCNNRTGSEWDSALAKQLNVLCVLLGIARERGDVPDELIRQASGKERLLQADGLMKIRHPVVSHIDEDQNSDIISVNVQARSLEEVSRITKELEASYAKKGGRLESVSIEDNYVYDLDPTIFQMSVGGGGASLSIVKTALAYAHHCGIGRDACEQAVMSFEGEIRPCFGYYYQRNDVIARRQPGIHHYLVLRGSRESRRLLCYVEYFGLYRMIVCLSRNYTGQNITKSYGIDPTFGKEVDVEVDFDISTLSIEELYGGRLFDQDVIKSAAARLIPVIQRRSDDLAHDRAVDDAIEYAQSRTKAELGDEYQEGTCDRSYFIERMLPFYEHLIRLRSGAGTPAPNPPSPESLLDTLTTEVPEEAE